MTTSSGKLVQGINLGAAHSLQVLGSAGIESGVGRGHRHRSEHCLFCSIQEVCIFHCARHTHKYINLVAFGKSTFQFVEIRGNVRREDIGQSCNFEITFHRARWRESGVVGHGAILLKAMVQSRKGWRERKWEMLSLCLVETPA